MKIICLAICYLILFHAPLYGQKLVWDGYDSVINEYAKVTDLNAIHQDKSYENYTEIRLESFGSECYLYISVKKTDWLLRQGDTLLLNLGNHQTVLLKSVRTWYPSLHKTTSHLPASVTGRYLISKDDYQRLKQWPLKSMIVYTQSGRKRVNINKPYHAVLMREMALVL